MADSMLNNQEKEKTLELSKAFAQEQDNVNATDHCNTRQMVLGNSVKHLLILIPNEGHLDHVTEMKPGLFPSHLSHKM
jgi:hypothetical protein